MQATVLVVEQDLLTRQTFVEMVGVCGYLSMGAEDAVQARDMLRNMTFDVVLSGSTLGSESGLAFADDVKLISPGTGIILILSDHATRELTGRAVDMHLCKPFSILQLRHALHATVSRSDTRQTS